MPSSLKCCRWLVPTIVLVAGVVQVHVAPGNPGTADVMTDVANYTTITPVLQTSECVG